MIKSISYDQIEILKWIQELYCPSGFECDLTYGNGVFWKELGNPKYCFDLDPLQPHVIEASSCAVPLEDSSLNNIVFDPPFLTYIRNGREHGNKKRAIMSSRFGGYWKYSELEEHYIGTLKECSRLLTKNGILIFKCQDIIHNHKMNCTHYNVIGWAKECGLELKDLFILNAKHRMSNKIKQKHARIFHSYFLVLEKLK